MTDRPIIFSAPMVRALLDGRKTQTRRVLGNSGPGRGRSNIFSARIGWSDSYVLDPGNAGWRERDTPYAPGDRLWVREAFVRYYELDECDMRVGPLKIAYRADGGFRWLDADTDEFRDSPPWKPSIHMPRWASRLTLLVTDVSVQRLQEISRGDAMEEGFPFANMADGPNPRDWYRDLWNSIHGPDAWDRNPWVAAISFETHRCNIDTMGEGT